jgi:hypothetical protein
MSPVELLREEQGAKARRTPDVDVGLPPSAFDVDCKYKECLVIPADTLTYHIFSYLCISQKEWWYSSKNLLRKVFFVFLASVVWARPFHDVCSYRQWWQTTILGCTRQQGLLCLTI